VLFCKTTRRAVVLLLIKTEIRGFCVMTGVRKTRAQLVIVDSRDVFVLILISSGGNNTWTDELKMKKKQNQRVKNNNKKN